MCHFVISDVSATAADLFFILYHIFTIKDDILQINFCKAYLKETKIKCSQCHTHERHSNRYKLTFHHDGIDADFIHWRKTHKTVLHNIELLLLWPLSVLTENY